MLTPRYRFLLIPLLSLACGATPANSPAPAATSSVSASASPVTSSPADAHRRAQAEVARLKPEADRDPMLAPWTGPYGGVPPWDKAKADLFPNAFRTALALMAAEVDVIANDPAPPSFANTMAALEDMGRHRRRAETLFSVLSSSLNTPDVQAVEREWSPKLTRARDEIIFNTKLFARIAKLYDARTTLGLAPEEKRLLEIVYDRFVQGGAKLDASQKAELGKINQELASLFTEFGNKVLADENTWIVLEKPEDLAGLAKSFASSLKAAADEHKVQAAGVVVNSRSSVEAFLSSSTRRDLREKVWRAYKNRGDNGNANDTNATITKIVGLRARRAALLGYPSHAHWRMFDTMAVDPAKADALMMRVWPAAVARVREEVKDMQALAKREGANIVIEPWDYLFYAEKVRKAKYALDQDELKAYFALDNMIVGAFFMAERLYGITFEEITGKVPVFHADVRVWEVKDKATGAHRGLFYGDYFARAHKRSGAWAQAYRSHESFMGPRTTLASNNNNFVKAAAGEPVLISLDDAQTLFHEFGHAIHGLLSEASFPGLANTPRDFVEYPSQVHEMWVTTRPVLDRYGLHYKTKQPMPQALIKKVEAAKRFNQGYSTVEYLSAAIVDMALHTQKIEGFDPDAFERDTLAKIGAPKEVPMRHRLPHFNHLFTSDSYSAGYYSYLWSGVMDADTREAFAEAGDVFHAPTAEKMRRFILAPANSTDRTEAYRQFRGRDPDVKALLKERGFPTGEPSPKKAP